MYSKQDIERYILELMIGSEKEAFEQQLTSDESLKAEVMQIAEDILEQMIAMKTTSGELSTESIQRYICKEMSEEEIRDFEKECGENPLLAYSLRLQKALSDEVRLRGATEMLDEKRREWEKKDVLEIPAAAFADESVSTDHPVKRIDFSKIFKAVTPIAVAACMVCGCLIWDHNVTVNVGNEAYSSVMRGGSELDNLILQEKYKEAIEYIDMELSADYSIVGEEAIAAYNQEMDNLRYTKAVILLKDGKKRQAKKILKQLNDERSNELLDKLLW